VIIVVTIGFENKSILIQIAVRAKRRYSCDNFIIELMYLKHK